MIDQNRIIIKYEVAFEPLEFPVDQFVDAMTTTNLSIVINNLEEFMNCNISVRAFTSVGPGPYSDPITERTSKDGNITPTSVYHIMLTSFCCSIFRTSSTSSKFPSHSHLLH